MTVKHQIILSAFRANLSIADNFKRSAEMHRILVESGMAPRLALGYYREAGQEHPSLEQSFIIDVVTGNEWATCGSLAELYEQDSILCIDNGEAWLDFAPFDDERPGVYIGNWCRVSQETAEKQTAYTFDGNQYWVAIRDTI